MDLKGSSLRRHSTSLHFDARCLSVSGSLAVYQRGADLYWLELSGGEASRPNPAYEPKGGTHRIMILTLTLALLTLALPTPLTT